MDGVAKDMQGAIPTEFDLPGARISAALTGALSVNGAGGGEGIGAKLDVMTALLTEMFPAMLRALDMDIVLDDGTLVGRLAPEIDRSLAILRRRGMALGV
jgi:hypothetical protein